MKGKNDSKGNIVNGTIGIVPNTPITRKLATEIIKTDSILRSVNNRLMGGHLDYDTHKTIINEYQELVNKLSSMNKELNTKLFKKESKKEKVIKAG